MALGALLADLPTDVTPAERLHALFEAVWAYEMEAVPERATGMGWPGQGYRWTDWSLEAVDHRKDDVDDILEALDALPTDGLDDVDRLSLELFRREYGTRRDGHRFPTELMPISKMTGIHQSIPRTISQMPAVHIGDLEDVVARLHGVSVLCDQHIHLLEEGVAAGLTQPRITVDDIPLQLDILTEADVATHPLLGAFAKRPELVEPADFDELEADARAALTEVALPALRRFRAHVADRYLPACRESVGWSELPNGADWYGWEVKRHTTTDLTPKEIHDLGVEEVARIRSEMAAVEAEAGFAGKRADLLEFLRTDDRFFCTSAEQLLDEYRVIAKRVDPELPRLFGTLPRLTYGVCPVPDHEAPSTTTAYYMRGAPDAGRPGWFYANTYDLRSRPRWEMEALTLHESVPGHHLQIALAAELPGLPRFRRASIGCTAFVEGWGLYAESLGPEMGFYTDPFSRFGQLAYEMWRAVRLVVDTGIHAFGWSRRQAVDFFADNTGKAMHDVAVEIDRYISWPGQALAYKLGELTFKSLRRQAVESLGERFDVRTFHDVVLAAGATPLDVVERRVQEWLSGLAG